MTPSPTEKNKSALFHSQNHTTTLTDTPDTIEKLQFSHQLPFRR